jgi:hypothetical protein
MSGTTVVAQIGNPYQQGGQSFADLQPLAGVTAQDTTAFTGPWIPTIPGSKLNAVLNLASLVGTLSVIVQTAQNAVTDPPTFCAGFQQVAASGSPQVAPQVGEGLTGSFVRVVATPGMGGGQAASWTITGKLVTPYAPIT